MPEETNLGIKTWIMKSVMSFILLILIAFIIERYTGYLIVTHSIIAIAIALSLGFLHEVMHYWKATKLGYQPKWYRTTFRMYFEVSSHSNRKSWREDMKKIGIAPYYVVVPLSFAILIIGLSIQHLGIIIGGLGSIILHLVSYRKEGEE